jgi:hypothetical protein
VIKYLMMSINGRLSLFSDFCSKLKVFFIYVLVFVYPT